MSVLIATLGPGVWSLARGDGGACNPGLNPLLVMVDGVRDTALRRCPRGDQGVTWQSPAKRGIWPHPDTRVSRSLLIYSWKTMGQ